MNAFDLSGRVAVVTGGGGGLGRPIAVALAQAGAQVVVAGRTRGKLDQTCDEISAAGGKSRAVALDLTRPLNIAAVVDDVARDAGRIDVLVNCAGAQLRQNALDIDEAGWDRVIGVNLKGVFFACQAAARHMARAEYGRIVNISSLTGEIGLPRLAAYGASKGGVNQLTRALAVEWAARGITVNAIGPGRIRTPMTEELFADPSTVETLTARIPMRRLGTPADLAGVAVFLASEASSYVTGQIIYVDGGWLASGGGYPVG